MITKGSRVLLTKEVYLTQDGIEASKDKPLKGTILGVRRKKIGKNIVKLCLFCPDISKDKTKGYEFSSKCFIELE